MPVNQTKTALGTGVAVTVAGALIMLAWDPTHADQRRLDDLERTGRLSLDAGVANATAYQAEVEALAQQPIFVMTTGPMAYKEKALQIFGVAISPGRRAALVSIDGGEAAWMAVGQVTGDIRLSAVGTNGASFDTPVGTRIVNLDDTPSSPTTASAAGG